jgi:hypothetical protein
MRRALDSVAQTLVMAAVVATLMCAPVGALLALFSYLFFDVSVERFVSFGGELHPAVGLLAWWALAFVCSLVYAAYLRLWPHH